MLASLCLITSGKAAYWTVPIDYYNDWSYLRFALDGTVSPYNENRGTDGHAATLQIYNVYGAEDDERGFVQEYGAYGGRSVGEFDYFVNGAPTDANKAAASLSIWVKPKYGNTYETIATRGTTDEGGFNLIKKGADALQFTFFSPPDDDGVQKIGSVYAAGAGTQQLFRDGQWSHILITQVTYQATEDGEHYGPYVAIYVDGYLRGSGKIGIKHGNYGGILGDFKGETRTDGYLGNLGESTYVPNAECSSNFAEEITTSGKCITKVDRSVFNDLAYEGVTPYFTGSMSDFRWFLGINLVCVSKTNSGYQLSNINVDTGTLCDIASDVSSLAQDRLELDNILLRSPFRKDLQDKQWEGMSQPASATTTGGDWGQLTTDSLRYSALAVDGDDGGSWALEYQLNKANTDLFGLSFWVMREDSGLQYIVGMPPEDDSSVPFITVNADKIGIGTEDSATSILWFSVDLDSDRWTHVAVSFDKSVLEVLDGSFFVSIYVDGSLVGAKHITNFPSAEVGDLLVSTLAGKNGNFKISDLLWTSSPITLPQVKRLASRWPGAVYEPNYPTIEIPHSLSYETTEDAYDIRTLGLSRNFVGPVGQGDYPYDSLSLEFEYDWSVSGTVWKGGWDSSTKDTSECKFVLGGIADIGSSANRSDWPIADSHTVLLCFTPAKIGNNVNPFTLLLSYDAYSGAYYLPLLDAPMHEDVLTKLSAYSSDKGVEGIKSRITINVSRYNIFVEVKTAASAVYGQDVELSYLASLYFGADALVSSFLTKNRYLQSVPSVNGATLNRIVQIRMGDSTQPALVTPSNSVTSEPSISYVDQMKLIADVDSFVSKDR